MIDRGLLLFFPAPRSYTGEDVAELQGHGGPVVLELLLRRVIELGARRAGPGEFSMRAFLNDKMDLTQAEAVADLIASATETQARAAQRSLSGELSRRVAGVRETLVAIRATVEGVLDFPDEEADFLAEAEVGRRLASLRDETDALLQATQQGHVLRNGAEIAIVGRPNVGKSTLMNALARVDLAIVTDQPGTTRDALRHVVDIEGIPVRLIDTAGLRETADAVEREGIRRSRLAAQEADHLLLLSEITHEEPELPAGWNVAPDRITRVVNKIDETGDAPGFRDQRHYISALDGAGLPDLTRHLARRLGTNPEAEGTFTARARQRDALLEFQRQLGDAHEHLGRQTELAAEGLRLAQEALNAVTGRFTADDLLGEIFSTFCIGK